VSSEPSNSVAEEPLSHYGSLEDARRSIRERRRIGLWWRVIFYLATTISVMALVILIVNIVNGAFGYVAVLNEIEPETLSERGAPLEELSKEELITILEENISTGLLRRFNFEQPLEERSKAEIVALVEARVVSPKVVETWNLLPSLFARGEIRDFIANESEPGTRLEFRAWLNFRFLVSPQSPEPQFAGVRTALLGSIWMIAITLAVAFPLGVGAAIYLEEYARNNRLNRVIQVNIYTLAGVPSIIYGLLGLAVFVRLLGPITSGAVFSPSIDADATGRTVLSAGLTLALLILPIIIISSQEAIRAVPQSLRDSSFGLGATKWQTIWHHVIPASFDRILTGTILAVSRAAGDTATLILTGAATVIFVDPDTLFSQFTALPIQIYQWSARPQGAFRNVAAAAIIVLLLLLLSMNAFAIITRDRIRRQRLM